MPQQYLIPKGLSQRFPGLQGAVWRLEAWLFRATFWLLAALPPAWSRTCAGCLFAWIGPLTSKAEKVRRNLAIAFPQLSSPARRRMVRETFAHLGKAMAELAQAPRLWQQREQRLEVCIEDESIAALAPGQAAVLVTAHVGAWQYTTLVAPWFDISLTSLYAPESNPYMRELFFRLRQGLGGEWLSRDSSMRTLMKELSLGHCIGLVTDIRVDEGEMLPLFGHATPTNTVPARLAMRYNCPLIAVRADRLESDRYRISLTKLISADPGVTAGDEQVRQMSLALNSEFERWITAYPGQWACMKRRWPKELDGTV